jgi:hypothetical protein
MYFSRTTRPATAHAGVFLSHAFGVAALSLLIACAAVGCGGRTNLTPGEKLGTTDSPGLPASAVYSPSLPGERLFLGGPKGRTPREERRTITADAPASSAWKIEFWQPDAKAESGWSLRRTVRLVQATDGSVAMATVDDVPEDSTTVFTPPLTLLPALLAGDDTFTAKSAVEIRSMKSGKAIDRGEATASASLRAPPPDSDISWSVWTSLVMTLSAARVQQRTLQHIHKERGMIREQESLRVRLGPLTIRSSDEAWTAKP